MPITTILFDAGGTLVHLDHRVLQKHLRQAGFPLSLHAVRRAEYAAKAEIDRRMLAAVADNDETRRRPYFAALFEALAVERSVAARVMEELDDIHARHNLWRVVLPSTSKVLADLQTRGLTLGVVSNSDGRIGAILEQCEIRRFFSVLIDSSEIGVEKPDPHIFHLALAQAHASPAQTLFVGDIYSLDIVGAQRTGMRAFLLDPLDCYTGVECEKIRHLRELLTRRQIWQTDCKAK